MCITKNRDQYDWSIPHHKKKKKYSYSTYLTYKDQQCPERKGAWIYPLMRFFEHGFEHLKEEQQKKVKSKSPKVSFPFFFFFYICYTHSLFREGSIERDLKDYNI